MRTTILLLLCLLILAGCIREAAEPESHYKRYTGTAPWTIEGARPGMTLDELKQRHGKPSGAHGNPPNSFSWQSPRLNVSVDADGRVKEVWGNSLQVGGQTIVAAGLNDTDINAILGKGTSKSMSQPGSFVLPSPGKHIGNEHVYHNGDVSFRFIVMKDRGLTGIVAQRK